MARRRALIVARVEAYIDTSGKETTEEEAAVQHAVGNVAELHILQTTGAEIAHGTKHANRGKGDKAHDDDLRPWRVV